MKKFYNTIKDLNFNQLTENDIEKISLIDPFQLIIETLRFLINKDIQGIFLIKKFLKDFYGFYYQIGFII